MDILTGILIPFIGTTAGSACVFFLRGELKPGVQKAFLGFASGVMVAASVWSLLIPAMEMSDGLGRLAFLPAVTGFLLGMAFLLFLDMVTLLGVYVSKLKNMEQKLFQFLVEMDTFTILMESILMKKLISY